MGRKFCRPYALGEGEDQRLRNPKLFHITFHDRYAPLLMSLKSAVQMSYVVKPSCNPDNKQLPGLQLIELRDLPGMLNHTHRMSQVVIGVLMIYRTGKCFCDKLPRFPLKVSVIHTLILSSNLVN